MQRGRPYVRRRGQLVVLKMRVMVTRRSLSGIVYRVISGIASQGAKGL